MSSSLCGIGLSSSYWIHFPAPTARFWFSEGKHRKKSCVLHLNWAGTNHSPVSPMQHSAQSPHSSPCGSIQQPSHKFQLTASFSQMRLLGQTSMQGEQLETAKSAKKHRIKWHFFNRHLFESDAFGERSCCLLAEPQIPSYILYQDRDVFVFGKYVRNVDGKFMSKQSQKLLTHPEIFSAMKHYHTAAFYVMLQDWMIL